MSLRDRIIRAFGGTPPSQMATIEARVHEITQHARLRARRELVPGIRMGMWVIWDGRICIANGITDAGLLDLHVINPDGTTMMTTHQSPVFVTPARIRDVPEPRRDVAKLRELGYED